MLSQYGLALLLALLFNAAANVLMKVGMTKVEGGGGMLRDGFAGGPLVVLSNPTLLIGLACFGLNAVFYMYALQSKLLQISIAYPVMIGGGYAIIVAVGFLLLGERLSPAQWAGVALILIGVGIVAIQTRPPVVA